MDKLDKMFDLRLRFMKNLENSFPGTHPSIPLDISKKSNQQILQKYQRIKKIYQI